MPPRISLALVVHNHQPVGNFGWVIADVFERAYEPLVGALERHPGVRLALHYSGPLLEWLRAERPAFVERVAALRARGQVELLGGGLYEPVLAALPERDRIGQLTRMADEVEAVFGQRPRGAWLAERVWEPDLPVSLVDAGYRWTVLDDAHLRAASAPDEALWTASMTDDQGRALAVFATEQRLRYLIPFQDVEATIAHLRAHATEDGRRLGVMGDDGEKLGAWPGTWQHCWGANRWVERFFEALEANAAWLATVTPSAWLERVPARGRVAIPTASYFEMTEWALPAGEQHAFAAAYEHASAEGRPEARWLRGGSWRNFQVRYREVNDLHKQMLRTSARVAAMPAGGERERALDHLYRGQSNDCYWHGLFGGIYLSHLRLATHAHLIAAQDAADRALGLETGVRRDLDLDGHPELLLETDGQVVTISPHEGGGIGSWDIRAARHALTAVMRRRPEAYHARLAAPVAEPGEREPGAGDEAVTPASIHDLVAAREPGLAGRLHVDAYERRSGLVHLLEPGTTPGEFADGAARALAPVDAGCEVVALEAGRAVLARTARVEPGSGGSTAVAIRTSIALGGGRLDPTLVLEASVANVGDAPLECRLGIELATTMLGGGGNPAAWWEIGGERSRHDASRVTAGVERLAAGNDDVGLSLALTASPAADAWIAPIETVSGSEGGFERAYQGSSLLLGRRVRIAPGAIEAIRIEAAARVARDRAAEEGSAGGPDPATGTPGR